MNKFAASSEFDHIYWRNPKWKTSFFVLQIQIVSNTEKHTAEHSWLN